LTARHYGGAIQIIWMSARPSCDSDGTTDNMTMIDQLTQHDRIELLARAEDAWDRAPQNTMRAVFEWRGKNYVVSHSSVQLRIHTEEGIKVY
jgi:hypothetical protein